MDDFDELFRIAYRYMAWRGRQKDFKVPSARRVTQVSAGTNVREDDLVQAYEHFKRAPARPSRSDIGTYGYIAYKYLQFRMKEVGINVDSDLRRRLGQVAKELGLPQARINAMMRHLIQFALDEYVPV